MCCGSREAPADVSALAGRAIEGGAARLDDPPNRCPTPAARFPLAIVDPQRDREVSHVPLGIEKIAQRRAPRRDRLAQHLPQAGDEVIPRGAWNPPHRALRM